MSEMDPGPHPLTADATGADAEAAAGVGAQVSGAAAEAVTAAWRRQWQSLWREWVRPLLIIALVMGSFRSAVADWNDVPTGSMKPTILEGDRIFINKIAYDLKVPFTTVRLAEWSHPEWGDVVVLRSPEDGKRLVKRVVGLPGDVIEIRGSRLVINGRDARYGVLDPDVVGQIEPAQRGAHLFATELLAEHPHPIMITLGAASKPYGPLRIPDDHYFVMGDNRDNSQDSRWFGPVHRESILGRATAVALSVDPENFYKPRWERFFSSLP